MLTTNDQRPTTPTRGRGPRRSVLAAIIACGFGVVAALAPVSLTGSAGVDAVERVVIVAAVSFVGAHGRRWSWLVAGGLAAVSARGPALGFVLAGLAVAAGSTQARRRSKPLGAASVGLTLNGIFWYGADIPTVVPHLLAVLAVAVVSASGFPELRRRPRRAAISCLLLVVGLATVAVGLAGYGAFSARQDVDVGTSAARRALGAIRRGDSQGARSDLAVAKSRLASASGELDGAAMAPIDLVPGAAQQARAVRVAVDVAGEVTDAADALVATDYDQLRYDGRIDLDRVADLEPQARFVTTTLETATTDLADVSEPMLLPPLRSRIEDLTDEISGARDEADFAAIALGVAPDLLGRDGPRHYLVAFMTPAELRGAGGFVGNWVELEADQGDVRLSRSGRIRELLDAAPPGARTLDGPADYVARYGRYHPEDNLQDVTLSPNWPSSASAFGQLYPQSGGREVDGVFGVDPTGLAALLSLTGPVEVPGLDMALDADNAVEFLTTGQYQLFPDSNQRTDVLEASIRATFEALTDAQLPSPRRLGDVLGPAARARHVQLWSPTEDEQRFFSRIHADGALDIPAGQDGLAVIQQNAGNNKIDAYLRREVDYQATIDAEDASLRATVTVTLHNDVPSLDLEPAVVGNNRGVPVGTNLTSLSLFTHHTVKSASIDGEPVVLAPDQEVGLQVWDTPLLSIEPGGSVTVTYELAGTLDLSEGYTFSYLPQPTARPDEVSVDIGVDNGRFATGPERARSAGPQTEPLVIRRPVRR